MMYIISPSENLHWTLTFVIPIKTQKGKSCKWFFFLCVVHCLLYNSEVNVTSFFNWKFNNLFPPGNGLLHWCRRASVDRWRCSVRCCLLRSAEGGRGKWLEIVFVSLASWPRFDVWCNSSKQLNVNNTRDLFLISFQEPRLTFCRWGGLPSRRTSAIGTPRFRVAANFCRPFCRLELQVICRCLQPP